MSLDQIDDLCDRFEAALRQGEPARIEDFLGQIEEEYRPKLLRELVEIELELSAQRWPESESIAQSPIFRLQESLKDRFPEESDLVDSIVRRVVKLRQIGDYEILEELGHGGMGIVYKARQKLLNQTVAIKVLSQTLLDDPQAIGRFRREMQLIGGLNHPNIVRALNAGESDGSHYLVMEYVDGITLQRLGDTIRKGRQGPPTDERSLINSSEAVSDEAPTVQHRFEKGDTAKDDAERSPTAPLAPSAPLAPLVSGGGGGSGGVTSKHHVPDASGGASSPSGPNPSDSPLFPVGAACEVIRQAALALQHAHEYGLVHRDVKPANLMLDRSGTVKLLDLGLGKFLADQRPSGESASLTMAGTTIGTIDYISPEQCENAGDVDIRADLYSLGCTLYFLLTGRPPYSGSRYDTTRKKLMAHIVGEIPKLQKDLPDIPVRLEAILEKTLAKEPAERFQTPIELAEAIAPFASPEQLQEMVDGELPGGKKRSPGSTSRISGTSNTVQASATGPEAKRRSWVPGNDAWWTTLPFWLPLVLGICLFLSLPGFFVVRNLARKIQGIERHQQEQQHQQQHAGMPTQSPTSPSTQPENRQTSPASVVSDAQTQRNVVHSDLALLPGLNGSWWFDETPWYLPVVRDLLLRKIDEAEDLKTVLGENPEYYYDPNVPAVQHWLWELVQRYRDELSPVDRELTEKIKTYYDTNFEDTDSEKSLQEFLDFFLAGHPEKHSPETPWRGVDLHTRALLEHRLAEIRNDRDLAVVASRRYEEALEQYRRESGPRNNADEDPEIVQKGTRSRRLEFLCLSDAARLEFLAGGNYVRAIRKFEEVTQQRGTGERLGALFQAELRAAHGALCAAAGMYDDSLFIRGIDMINRSRAGERMHPLAAQLAERYAWSLLDQWKVREAERRFTDALFIREANRRESKNPFAAIYTLHNWHGLAMSFRYLGNTDRATEEYRKTLTAIDKELGECRSNASSFDTENTSGLRRYHASLRERAANTRERLADCTLYGGAASGIFSRGRLEETARLYEEAARLYFDEGTCRTMQAKHAIVLMLLGETDHAEQILCDLDERKRSLLGNQIRTELLRQVADALLVFRKKNGTDGTEKGRQMIRQFLRQFTIPTNPVSAAGERRETLELRLFAAEYLVDDSLDRKDYPTVAQDILLLMQPIGVFMNRPESRPFLRRISDLIVRTGAMLYDTFPDASPWKQAQLERIVRMLQWIRLRDPSETTPVPTSFSSEILPTLVVFFMTDDAKDGFVVFYPQEDGRTGALFRLPLTRQQVKGGAKKQGSKWKLDPELVGRIDAERKAGRPVDISWNDEACWARNVDALLDTDWPFGDELTIEN